MIVGSRRRPAVILPVVLFILVLIGLLAAMFSFRINADVAASRAQSLRLQTRLAAEAGVEAAKLILTTRRAEMSAWYNNPDELHRIIVWSAEGDETYYGTNAEDFDERTQTVRFSLVADDPTDDEDFLRFGMTDESAKLNLNLATEGQLKRLVSRATGDDPEVDPGEIVAAIMDWRDSDSEPRGVNGDTEGDYYAGLERSYPVKNGPFTTVEELLLVKGVTPEILYGEDFDRNGLLTEPNEDDGEDSFPLDNRDGVLNQGLYPYLTVSSYETNVSNANQRRIYLKGDQTVVRGQLEEVFPDEPGVVNYILEFFAASGPSGQGQGGDGQGGQGGDADGGGNTGNGNGGAGDAGGDTGSSVPDKSGSRRQRREEPSKNDGKSGDATTEDSGEPQQPPSDGETEKEETDDEEGEPQGGEGAESADERNTTAPIASPVSLLLPRSISGELRTGPVGPEHLARLLDRTTVIPPEQERIEGLINVNTAPRPVLECLEDLSPDQIDRIIEVRQVLEDVDKETFAWLATEEIVDLETLEKIAPKITGRGQQFTIESLGFADHAGMVTRLLVTIDMMGPIPQVIYYRDNSYLGASFPIREEDLERVRGR